ncbi:MAG: ABC transporter permease [Candidatus Eremiobacteraeota bacterium]|nr:ABC transporter permease [Candidatus Eremiobacteraeota bacterium]
MNLFESLLTGFRELWSHKMHSLLTMLGVIFGVAAVISMVSIQEGARQEAIEQIRRLGTNIILVKRLNVEGEELEKSDKKSPSGLCYGDAGALMATCPLINGVACLREVTTEIRGAGKKPVNGKIFGVTPDYPLITNMKLRKGRFITYHDIDRFENVCVLGAAVRRQLFAFEDAIDKKVKIGKRFYICIGVVEDRSSSGGSTIMQSRDMNLDIYIPISTSVQQFALSTSATNIRGGGSMASLRDVIQRMKVRYILERAPVSEIVVQVMEERQILEIAHIIKTVLGRRHNNINDFEIVIPLELLKQSQETQRIFNIVMGAIAGISLLVGGIGIMNIMLATITQRTREIGIRRCLGATKINILIQFLMECLVITTLGGIIGVAVGILLAKSISYYAQWTTVISYLALVVALSVSIGTGVIFGLYPAYRAASIDPITALKYE